MVGMRAFSGIVFAVITVTAFGQESRKADEPKPTDIHADAPVVVFHGHDDEVTSLSFSADGNKVISVSAKAVCVWDPATGKEIRRLKVDDRTAIGFNSDLSRLAFVRPFYFGRPADSPNGKITLQDTANGNTIWSIDPHGNFNRDVPFPPAIAALAFSSDGKSLVSSGGAVKVRGDWPKGIVKIWDAESGKELRKLDELSSRADAVMFSSDGKLLAAGTTGTSGELPASAEVHVWDAATGQRLHSMKTQPKVEQGGNPGSVIQLAIHPKGTLLAAAVSDGTVRLWELPSGRELFELRGHQGRSAGSETDRFTGLITGRSAAVRTVAFNPDGSRLASAGYDGIVRVWNSQTGEQTATYRFDSPCINAVVISSDGQCLAAAGSNSAKSGEVVIWKLRDQPTQLGGPVSPAIRKDEIAKHELEVRKRIQNAVKSDELNWQNLDVSQRSVRDRIAKILVKTVTVSDQQVASAVYLLTVGRHPTDVEAKQVQTESAETQDRPLSVLKHARGLVQSKEFNTELAATNERLRLLQENRAKKSAPGEIPVLFSADSFLKIANDCAAVVDQAAKTDEQLVELSFLLTLSRFPSTTEANQLVPHLKNAPNRALATKDIFVFLLNGEEFVAPK